jgi:hypothetical protein
MSVLYEIRMKIEKTIQQKKLDEHQIRGAIGLRCGLLLNFITPDTPDDPAAVERLKRAVLDVLKVQV